MAILYVGWHSAGEGLSEEDAQACVNHFSRYIEWRGMAVEQLHNPISCNCARIHVVHT